LVEVVGEEVVNLNIIVNQPPPLEKNGITKINLGVKVASIRVVHIQDFLMELVHYALDINEMRELLEKTAKKATERAIELATSEKITTLFSFDVDMSNPTFIVPVSRKSRHSLLLDLGHITLHGKPASVCLCVCLFVFLENQDILY
jgi:hypothetical protein